MNKLRPHVAVAVIAFAALSVGSLVPGVASGLGREPRSSASFIDGFPLWRALNTDRFAVPGRGHIHDGKWEVFATAQARRNRHREPCLTVARIMADGALGSVSGCGAPAPLDGPLRSPVDPTITEFVRRVDGSVVAATYLALSVAPTIRQVELELVPGPNSGSVSRAQELLMETKSLSVAQSRRPSSSCFAMWR